VKSDPSNQLAVEGPALVISLIDEDEERYPDTAVLQNRDEEDIEDVHIESYIDGRQMFYKQVQIIIDDVKSAMTEVNPPKVKGPFDIYRICHIADFRREHPFKDKLDLNRKCYETYMGLTDKEKAPYRAAYSRYDKTRPTLPLPPITSSLKLNQKFRITKRYGSGSLNFKQYCKLIQVKKIYGLYWSELSRPNQIKVQT